MNAESLQEIVKKTVLVFLLTEVSLFTAFSQTGVEDVIETNRETFSEEINIVTDRDLYIAGETVYFKLFCIDRLSRQPSGISTVAYTSLLDAGNNPVSQVKITLDASGGSGSVTLPDTISTGCYFISSCTRWMQNYSPELFAYKKISVINPFQSLEKTKIPDTDPVPVTVTFFPEGGSIIPGDDNVVGLRCVNRKGYPVDLRGSVIDENGNVICKVSADSTGIGFFTVRPADQGKLFLLTESEKYLPQKFSLPVVSATGVTITLAETANKDAFDIRILKTGSFRSLDKDLFLVYEPLSFTPFRKEISASDDDEVLLDRHSLPPGLARMTIKDRSGKEYAERWVYNEAPQKADLAIKPEKRIYSEREKVRVGISCFDAGMQALQSRLAVSVVKSFSASHESEMSGNPMFLMALTAADEAAPSRGINTRLIFFKGGEDLFSPVRGDTTEMIIPEPEGHVISGSVRKTSTGQPVSGENMVLSFVGKTALCSFSKSNSDGWFYFPVKEEGTREIVIQPLNPEVNGYYIELDNPFPEKFSSHHPGAVLIDTTNLNLINQAIINFQIARVYQGSTASNSVTDKSTRPDFYGDPDYSIEVARYIQLTSVKEIIKELVPGVVTRTRRNRTYITFVFKETEESFEMDPLVLVDGIPVPDHGKVLEIVPDDLEKIEVLVSRYFVSSAVLNGVFDLTTKKGNMSLADFEKPIFRQEFDALQIDQSFISPAYETAEQKENRIPDFRNTLYWNAGVVTDNDGKAYIEFYTSDESGEFTIVAEGLTSTGERVRKTYLFTVKPD